MLYLAIILFLLYLSAKYDFDDRAEVQQSKEKSFWIVCAIFVLIAGLRYNIGGDTADGYAPEYFSFPAFDFNSWKNDALLYSRYQPGWFIFESICRLISPNFLLLQFVHALFINVVYFYFIKKYSKFWFATILIYAVSCYMKLNTEVLRESMAVAFGLLAYDCKIGRRYIPMILLVVLSFLFHVSGFMATVLLLFSLFKDTRRTRVILFCVFGVLAFSFASFNINTSIVDFIFNEGQMDMYFSQKIRYSYGFLGWILFVIERLVFPIAVLCFVPIEEEKKTNIPVIFILFVFLMFMSLYTLAFNRFADYLFPFYWIAISTAYGNVLNRINYKFKSVVLTVLFLFVFYIYYGDIFSKDNSHLTSFNMTYERYYPYRSVLEKGNTYFIKY